MTGLAASDHAVGGLAAVVLVVEVDQEGTDLGAQHALIIAGAELPGAGLLGLDQPLTDAVGHLAVLHAAERAFGVGVQVPALIQPVQHVQGRQRSAVVSLERTPRQHVDLLLVDAFIAHARGDGPQPPVDAVVQVDGMGLGLAAGVTVIAAGDGGQQAAGGAFPIAQLVTGLVDVAIADADLVVGGAQIHALRGAGLDAAHPVVARRQRHEVALVQEAAAQRFGEEGVDAGLAAAVGVVVAGTHQRATAPETVHRTGGLVGVGLEGVHRQATRHVGFAVIVLGDGVNAVHGIQRVLALQDHVIDASVAVLAIVGTAYTRIQDGAAQAVVHRAAHTEAGVLLGLVLRRGRAVAQLHAGVDVEVLGDRPGDEVDDAAHVLGAIAHGTTTAHHVHRIHVAHRDRAQRQLRLAIGRIGNGNAVHQQRGAGGQTRVQTANAEVQRHVMAAGTVVLGGVDARNAVEHLAHVGQALGLDLFTADHVTGTRMLLHVLLVGITQPVPHHRDGAQRLGLGCRSLVLFLGQCAGRAAAGSQQQGHRGHGVHHGTQWTHGRGVPRGIWDETGRRHVRTPESMMRSRLAMRLTPSPTRHPDLRSPSGKGCRAPTTEGRTCVRKHARRAACRMTQGKTSGIDTESAGHLRRRRRETGPLK